MISRRREYVSPSLKTKQQGVRCFTWDQIERRIEIINIASLMRNKREAEVLGGIRGRCPGVQHPQNFGIPYDCNARELLVYLSQELKPQAPCIGSNVSGQSCNVTTGAIQACY